MHDVLGERFARFKARGGLGGTNDEAAGGAEAVDDAGGERGFGTDDGEIDAERFGQSERIGCGVAGGDGGDSGVAGRGVKMDARGLGELPRDGVFAAAGANDENFQGMVLVPILAGALGYAVRVELI